MTFDFPIFRDNTRGGNPIVDAVERICHNMIMTANNLSEKTIRLDVSACLRESQLCSKYSMICVSQSRAPIFVKCFDAAPLVWNKILTF